MSSAWRERPHRSDWNLWPLLLDSASWTTGLAVAVLARYELAVPVGVPARLLLMIVPAIGLHSLIAWLRFRFWPHSQYGSFEEVLSVTQTVLIVAAVLLLGDAASGSRPLPLSVPLVGGFVSLVLMLATRYGVRLYRERLLRPDRNVAVPVLLFGAGDAGRQLARAMLRRSAGRYLPVGFLDDDARLRRELVNGVPILGSRSVIGSVATQVGAQGIICSIARADAKLIRDLAALAQQAGLWIKVLPSVDQLLDGPVRVSDVRDIDVYDILGRHQIQTDLDAISEYITGKRVLVTGAGGSIGAELSRQLHQLHPGRLLMLDRDESALHSTLMSIYFRADLDSPDVILADIRDRTRLAAIFDEQRPQVVFHAAALKHLALLEQYPGEATQSNVWGTLNLLEAAVGVEVERFVNVSTDKAADPVNVLGYTKRITERLTAGIAREAAGSFLSVRFGNVLGSRGSVLTTFAAQIARGGPITVTDPSVTRYFMTISEAVQLVIQAGAVGRAGEALVLDMGQPVGIADVARQLAAQAPGHIEIVYTGLKEGEKLHETLLGEHEVDTRPMHPLISHVAVPPLVANDVRGLDPWVSPKEAIKALRRLCELDAEVQIAARPLALPAGPGVIST